LVVFIVVNDYGNVGVVGGYAKKRLKNVIIQQQADLK